MQNPTPPPSTATDKLPFAIRLGTVKDTPFIVDSWVKMVSNQYPNQYALDFRPRYQDHVTKILAKSVTLVAHLEGEPDEILSYLVYSSFRKCQVIQFAYTKFDARKQGLLNALLAFSNESRLPVVFTVAAKNGDAMHHFAKRFVFDPTAVALVETP